MGIKPTAFFPSCLKLVFGRTLRIPAELITHSTRESTSVCSISCQTIHWSIDESLIMSKHPELGHLYLCSHALLQTLLTGNTLNLLDILAGRADGHSWVARPAWLRNAQSHSPVIPNFRGLRGKHSFSAHVHGLSMCYSSNRSQGIVWGIDSSKCGRIQTL